MRGVVSVISDGAKKQVATSRFSGSLLASLLTELSSVVSAISITESALDIALIED